MAETDHGRRRFVTRHDVEDAAAAGRSVVLGARDVLTDEAAQRVMELGVQVDRTGAGSGRGATAAGSEAPTSRRSVPDDELRRAVRAAVVAELGREPDGLDSAIDRVLGRRR